jgi:CBS domain-containing protein
MLCQELMKHDVQCISPEDPCEEAAKRMRDGNVGFLPVCDPSKKVLGAITDRDLAVRVVAANRPARTTPVFEAMTHEVISCSPSDDVRLAERLMARNHKSRIVCLDGEGRLAGIISLSDIAVQDGPQATRTLREVSEREARVSRD